MAENNPANDGNWTNTPRTGMTEFDTLRFDEIEDGDLFWEGPIKNNYFHGHGLEMTPKHAARGAYNNGLRNGWWLILENDGLENPWRGVVLFEDGDVVESESFGFSSVDEQLNFSKTLHPENFSLDISDAPAGDGDLIVNDKIMKASNKTK